MLRFTLIALSGLLALASQPARGEDVKLLKGSPDSTTLRLDYDGDADTELARFWRHRAHFGGYRGFYGGYYGGGFYRPYYGYYRPYYGFYRPYAYYSPYFYRPYVYSGYYPYYSGYYPYYSYFDYCITYDPSQGQPQVLNLNGQMPRVPEAGGNQTFPYNGGPTNPVPMPGAPPANEPPKLKTATPDSRFVSLPKQTSFAYPAYGQATPTTQAKTPATTPPRNVSAPAPNKIFTFHAYGQSRP